MSKTTAKRKAMQLIAKLGCTLTQTREHDVRFIRYEIESPDGYRFSSGSTTLVCGDWQDIIDRLRNNDLEALEPGEE